MTRTPRLEATLATIASLMLTPQSAHAGAWTMPAGEGQMIVSVLTDTATANFDDNGERAGDVAFQKFEASIYSEFGLTDRITILTRPAYQQVELRGPLGSVQEASGAAATEFGARYAAYQGERSAVSVQVGAFLPGAGENLIDARFGEGGMAGETRALAGIGWGGPAAGFVEAQVAARVFEGQDEIEGRADLTGGVQLSPSSQAIAQSFNTWSDGGGAIARRPYRSHKAQVSVIRDLSEHWSLQAGAFQTVAGRNVVEEQAGFVSVWLSY